MPHTPFCTGYTSSLLSLLDVHIITEYGRCMPHHIQLGEGTVVPEAGRDEEDSSWRECPELFGPRLLFRFAVAEGKWKLGVGYELNELFQWTRFRLKFAQTNCYFIIQLSTCGIEVFDLKVILSNSVGEDRDRDCIILSKGVKKIRSYQAVSLL